MTRRIRQILSASVLCWLVLAVRPGVSAQPPDACERLASMSFPHARITSAARVEAGQFSAAAGRRGASEPFAELGAFCRRQGARSDRRHDDPQRPAAAPPAGVRIPDGVAVQRIRQRRRPREFHLSDPLIDMDESCLW
jgi:hypothetical protein